MRTYRLAIFFLFAACKATTPTSSVGGYTEDLSVHRPQSSATSQSETKEEATSRKEAYVPLTGHIKDELDSIAKIAYEQNKAGRKVDGYVIQVYSGTSRNDANEAQIKAAELFPDLEAKITYRQPSFRVKGGKFIDRLEANRIYNEVKKEFPRALLIPERLVISYE